MVDFFVLVFGCVTAGGFGVAMPWPGLASAFVIANYFLFCNVVRMSRSLELVWAALFVALAASTVVLETPGWPTTLAIASAITVVLVAIEAGKPSYHGVLWQWINPELPKWWSAHAQTEQAP